MSRAGYWVLVLAQLGLAASWLLTAAVYIATPKPMAQALAMADGVRQGLGLAMAIPAVLVVVGTLVRGRTVLVSVGVTVLAVSGILWSAYDLSRHWSMFVFFHATLAVLALGILLARTKLR